MHHADFWFDSYDAIKARVGEALASSAECILLSVDSPGGLVAGCFDTVRDIRTMAANAGKKLYSYVDATSFSGGYALACAGERVFIPPSGIVGSIGVISDIVEVTAQDEKIGERHTIIKSGARKTDGNPHAEITPGNVAAEQVVVDDLAEQFFALVADCRGVPVESIAALQAGVLVGTKAVDAGLADEIATFDEVIAILSGPANGSRLTLASPGTSATGQAAASGKFEEDKHPRGDDGKFGSGTGSSDKSSDSTPARSEKHGEAKVRTSEDLAKELPKDKNGKQSYEGFPVSTINKVHEFSGETGLRAIIFRKDRNGKEVQTYKYTSEHEQASADAKFKKAAKMAENMPALRKRIAKDSASSDAKTSDAAVVVRLIDATTIRVGGSDSEKETGSVGATTLRVEHVIRNEDGSINLKFPGKSHKEWDRRVDGPLAAEILKRVEGKKPGDRVFGVSASDVNGYLAKASPDKITAKDFRTFHASSMAFSILSSAAPPPKISAKEAEAKIKEAIEATSKHLGNTPAICREKYINPRVLDAYRNRVVQEAA
jgi:ClpP class serine protease